MLPAAAALREQRLWECERMVSNPAPAPGEHESRTDNKDDPRVVIRVSHRTFVTTEGTLTATSGYFRERFSGDHRDGGPDGDGAYFVNADPVMFELILDYCRLGKYPLLWDAASEGFEYGKYAALKHWAQFFDILDLEDWIKREAYRNAVLTNYETIIVESLEEMNDRLDDHAFWEGRDMLEISYMWTENGRHSGLLFAPERRRQESDPGTHGEGLSEALIQGLGPISFYFYGPRRPEFMGVLIKKTVIFNPEACYRKEEEEPLYQEEEEFEYQEEEEFKYQEEEAFKYKEADQDKYREDEELKYKEEVKEHEETDVNADEWYEVKEDDVKENEEESEADNERSCRPTQEEDAGESRSPFVT